MQEKFGFSHHSDAIYLRKALELARINRGSCAPNPAVGAVIVRDGLVIASGYHTGPGNPHAEPDAISKLPPGGAKGATLYVTLEPCCHYGRTPPCTQAIIKAGIARVVFGYCDPNPIVAGKGQAELIAAGVPCDYVDLHETYDFYASYRYWQATQKPFITAKIALSLDGKIAALSGGAPIAITGAALKEFTHQRRKQSDAILTTAKTIHFDDPQLNARCNGQTLAKHLYVLDTQLTLSPNAKVFSTTQSITIFHAKTAATQLRDNLIKVGARCIAIDHNEMGLMLEQAIHCIGQDGKHDLWVEAGGKCFSAFAREHLLQRAFIYIGWKWVGAGQSAFNDNFSLEFLTNNNNCQWLQFDKDVMCEIQLT